MKQNIGIGAPKKIKFNQELQLKKGVALPEFELMIETYGTLNQAHSNAILICHALSGNHHVAGRYTEQDKYPGWWDTMVGPGKPIDTNHFFVVGLNNLGGCYGSTGPGSINPKTGKLYGSDFPVVTVEDWVQSQALLADYLEIPQWAAVAGGSLGGMQALQWAIDFPERLKHAVIIASAPQLSAQNIAFNDVARQAILSDPDFDQGFYQEHNKKPRNGLKIARMMGHITYLAEQGLGMKFGRELKHGGLQYNYDTDFEVESYLRYQGDKFSDSFDGNSYLLMTKALDYFDPAQAYGGELSEAVKRIQAKTFLVSFSSDWRFAPKRSKEILQALIHAEKAVQYLEVESIYGHDAFLLDDPAYIQGMQIYFERINQEVNHVAG
ncbi:homoserine O-acetyltransferase [Neisseriaceae bacterium PsAf]|nr:homoserine O-acetyltransferase [Neisseriaceae bacterium PsAf]